MSLILSVMFPVFSLIAVGYLAVRLKIISETADEAIGDFIFRIGIPILLALTMYRAEFVDASPSFLWLAYYQVAYLSYYQWLVNLTVQYAK